MSKIVIQLHRLEHRGGQYLQIKSPNTENAKQHIRSIAGRKWSQTHCCWYVPWKQECVDKLAAFFEITDMPAEFSLSNQVIKRSPKPTRNESVPIVVYSNQQGRVTGTCLLYTSPSPRDS